MILLRFVLRPLYPVVLFVRIFKNKIVINLCLFKGIMVLSSGNNSLCFSWKIRNEGEKKCIESVTFRNCGIFKLYQKIVVKLRSDQS
jgi:hypothetical protein